MEANAYNKHIRDQIEAINHKYVRDMQRQGYMLSDMDITPNVAVREGEGILSTGLSLLGLGKAPKVARAGGEYMGEGLLDQIGRGFSQGFMMPFKLLGLGKEGGAMVGGRRRGRPRKMAGVSTGGAMSGGAMSGGAMSGGEIGLNLREQNPNYLLAGAMSGGAMSGGRRGRKPKAMKEGEGILSSVLGAIGLGKEAGAMTGGMRRKMTTIPYNTTGGAMSGGRRGRKPKAMKEGEGILSSVLGAIGLGKEGGVSTGGAMTGGRRRRMRAGVSTGGGLGSSYSNLMNSLGLKAGAMSGGRRKRGGIQTGGLARAVGSGMGELEGSGFFDDVLDKVSSIAGTVKKGVDIGKDLGLIKGKGRKRAGVSTGGKRGASKWIEHVKAHAKKHGMKYNEALKDPRTKASYRK